MTDRYSLNFHDSSDDIPEETIKFLESSAEYLSNKYGTFKGWRDFDFDSYFKNGWLLVCKRDDKLIGFMLIRLYKSVFDNKTVLLRHDVLYGLNGTRAAYYLFKAYLDFGKKNADHILGTLGEHTNIKPSTLEKLGFKKLDTIYRLEVK